MPGVPSGKGCDACRKQKKKCDQAKPACARCARLNIPCIGSGKQRYKFKVQTLEIGSDSGSPQIVDTDEDTYSSSSQSSSSPLSFQALVRVPSSPTNIITNTLISRLEITDLRYDITCYGDFLRHIPARLGRNEALDTSADALATTFSTLHRPQGHQSVDALTKYVRALKSLRVVLSDPRKARTPETMCAVYLIMICQGWLGREDDQHTSHGEGLAYLLRAAAQENWKAGFETEMVLTFCVPVIIESITNPKVRLDKWFWDMLDNFRRSNPPTSTAEGAEARNVRESSGGIPSLRMRNLGMIPDFINQPELHRMEITCAYHRLRLDMEKMSHIVQAVSLPPGSSPTVMQLRLSRSYYSAYSVLLCIIIIINHLMQAFDPYSLSLVSEGALFCSEVITMAHNISQYRPLGASHVPLTLAIAWAATDEPIMKGQLEALLSEYQEDWTVTKWLTMGYWWRSKFTELRERFAPRIQSQEQELALIKEGEAANNLEQAPEQCCVQ
ncbi:Zn(2)-C6 fungal-type domain-containing protein [Fusarium sp. LHS14.1]|nr:Zn(2)-C6 fungal-type domain-containing protein [Fusarium sp. LHS14.1]